MAIKKHIILYSISNIVNAMLPFLLLPILTKYLSPEDFGRLTVIQILISISLPFILLNIHGLFIIEYSKLNKKEFGEFISSMLWIPIISFFILQLLFFIFQNELSFYLKISNKWILLSPLFILIQVIPTIIGVVFQAKSNPKNYGIYKISLTIVNFLFTLLFIVIYSMGLEGRMWAIFYSFIFFTFIGLLILYKEGYLHFYISLSNITNALKFGIPLLPHSIAGIFLSMSDKLFLSSKLDAYEVGVYSLAFQLSSGLLIFMTSVNQAWVPYLYNQLNNNPDNDIKKNIVKQTYKIMVLMSITTIIFIFIIPLLYRLFIDNKYQDGLLLAQILTFGFMFQGFYFMLTNYIFYVKKTYFLSLITVLSVFLLWVFLNIFVSYFGLYGAAYSLVCGYSILFILTWILANKLYPMPWLRMRRSK